MSTQHIYDLSIGYTYIINTHTLFKDFVYLLIVCRQKSEKREKMALVIDCSCGCQYMQIFTH